MRRISTLATILITSFVMALAGIVASPIASASENGNGSISATFPLGSSVLSDAQKAAIKKTVASSGSDVSFTVTGTAGKLPGVSDRWVQRLAKKRAQAIKAYLVSLGVSKTSVTTQVKITIIGVRPKSTGSFPTSASTVTTTNSAGTGSGAGGGATTPGAPTSVNANGGNAQSVVSWTAPTSTGGATITGYTATSNPGSLTCTTASISCTVTGLTNGTAYTFTVTATNSAGTGSASTASSSMTPATTPGAPTSVSGTVRSASSVVSWSAPASTGGAAITVYRALANPGGLSCSTASTSCTVTGLTNGRSYTFTVEASNSAGTGPASTASSSVIPEITYAIGDTGLGGGIVFYVDSVGFSCGASYSPTGSPTGGLCKYLEVAPNTWSGVYSDPLKKWAVTGNDTTGISGITDDSSAYNNALGIGLGYKNSDLIVAQNGLYDASTNNYAAGAARAYTGGSKTDWYLPTAAELNVLCRWNRGMTNTLATVATLCQGSRLINEGTNAGVTAFMMGTYSRYWSSSEVDGSNAWAQTIQASAFAASVQASTLKNEAIETMRVRPIRAY